MRPNASAIGYLSAPFSRDRHAGRQPIGNLGMLRALRRGSGRAAWRRLSVALDGRTLLEETDVTLHDGRLLGVLPSFTDSGAGSAHVTLGASMRACMSQHGDIAQSVRPLRHASVVCLLCPVCMPSVRTRMRASRSADQSGGTATYRIGPRAGVNQGQAAPRRSPSALGQGRARLRPHPSKRAARRAVSLATIRRLGSPCLAGTIGGGCPSPRASRRHGRTRIRTRRQRRASALPSSACAMG